MKDEFAHHRALKLAADVQRVREHPRTNADIIRNMTDEELADFLDIVEQDGIASQCADSPCDYCYEKTECAGCWKEWLQAKAD